MKRSSLLLFFVILSQTAFVIYGCSPVNQGSTGNGKKVTGSASSSTGNGFTPPTTGASDLSLINASFAAASAGAAGGIFTLYFDSSTNNSINVSSVCTAGAGGANSMPCSCRFSWTEINPSSGIGVTRTVDTDVTQPLPYSLQCNAPSIWESEIPDGTVLNIKVVPNTNLGSTVSFASTSVQYTKQSTSTVTGDFRDSEGKSIKNIVHYTCYDYFSKNLTIEHATSSGTPRTGGTNPSPAPSVPLANFFLSSNAGISAQSYWYDFYVRSHEVGSIVKGISGMTCPEVKINKSGTITSQVYPLDSSFSLALQRSRNYPIEVRANTTLNNSGQGSAAVVGTLGYAARPNTDGSCPAFTDSNGLTRRTFRLRRYIVNYPLRYNADGSLLSTIQPTNTLYIVDRPVDKTGQDPLKPLTRLGPKPCPFSFNMNATVASGAASFVPSVSHTCTVPRAKIPYAFNSAAHGSGAFSSPGEVQPYTYGLNDGKIFGLVGSGNSYAGNARTYCLPNGTTTAVTGSGGWISNNLTATCALGTPTSGILSNDFVSPKNIDGTAIVRSDCPIYPPPAANLGIDASLQIRPLRGFVPDFLEDTTYLACAFQSSNPIDPDIISVFNSYSYPQSGDRTTDDPKKARGFYCARTYADPSWMEASSGGSSTKTPGSCDSGRPKGSSSGLPSKYYVPKTNIFASTDVSTGNGYINLGVNPVKRTVPDAQITSYAIMNEKQYACSFTYNPTMSKSYNGSNQLTDMTTPRSGCCQRCAGSSKSGACSLATPSNTAENRGIHSLVPAIGPWYNRYNKPAFTMQSVLLSGAPFQLLPNTGSLNTANNCYNAATKQLTAACTSKVPTSPDFYSTGGTAIVTGTWQDENTGTAVGCYDPSEDP